MSDASLNVSGTVFDENEVELAVTYSEALLGAASKTGAEDAVLNELDELIEDVWNAHPQFAALLASPTVPVPEKERILTAAFESRALPLLLRFLQVLNNHGRLGLLPVIAREARSLWDRRCNRRHVSVKSAVPLDDGQLAALRERLAGIVHGTPILHTEVDPSLIGGLVIQIDDNVYDASVRTGHLERFRRRLVEQKTHEVLARYQTLSTS